MSFVVRELHNVIRGVVFASLAAVVPVAVMTHDKAEIVTPEQLHAALKTGMDVDWVKTGNGIAAFNEQAVIDTKARGFDHVRIRIRDYYDFRAEIKKGVFSDEIRVLARRAILLCLKHDLIPVLAYQGGRFKSDPTVENRDFVVEWWRAMAEHLRDVSYWVAFNLIIEVTEALNKHPDKLNDMFAHAVPKIRQYSPHRIVIPSPVRRSDPEMLPLLKIPVDAPPHVMAEWHLYAAGPKRDQPKKQWTIGTQKERQLIIDKFNHAMKWQQETGILTWVGAWMPIDFNDDNGGSYTIAEGAEFANFMSCQMKKFGVPHAVNSDTKYYNRETNTWIQETAPLVNAILNPSNCDAPAPTAPDASDTLTP